jgi:glucokinase
MNWNLVADIGGTNCRLAMAQDGRLLHQQSSPTSTDAAVMQAVTDFIDNAGSAPERIVVAAAGAVANGGVTLTNASETLLHESSFAELASTGQAWIINDFEAAAWSLLTVAAEDTLALQGPQALPSGNRMVMGPGTGLGVGALVFAQGRPVVVPGEGGHIGISPSRFDDIPVFEAYISDCDDMQIGTGLRFEAEAFLSGTGLPHLYRAVCTVRECAPQWENGEQIFAAAREGRDAAAVHTAQLFSYYLGQVAGDLTLLFAPQGGLFITGGVSLRNRWLFDQAFLQAFNAGGRDTYTQLRSATPLYLYTDEQFGLAGSMNAAQHLADKHALQ